MAQTEEWIAGGNLTRFFQQEHPKVIRYISYNYHLSADDAEDCFQEGSVALWQNVRNHKLTKENLTCSLSTYLMRCCCNHATHLSEKQTRMVSGDDFFPPMDDEPYQEMPVEDERLLLLEKIVAKLPEPCHTILWNVYFNYREVMEQAQNDETLMDVIAVILGMNKDTLKTTKNRCMAKLKDRTKTLLNEA